MEYTGSAHNGETESGRFEGEGVFKFPNGSEYVGSFKDGMFHGEGKIIVPGCGEYKATWQNGREVSSSYTFSDGLAYEREKIGNIAPLMIADFTPKLNTASSLLVRAS